MFMATLFKNAKIWKQAESPWTDTHTHTHTHTRTDKCIKARCYRGEFYQIFIEVTLMLVKCFKPQKKNPSKFL